MHLTMKQIEAFYWSVKLGSFSDAASHLNTTQSAISKRIIELEEQLGVPIFDRHQKRPVPTAKGRQIVRHAEEILELSFRIKLTANESSAFEGAFRFGVTELGALTWLPEVIRALKTRYPRLMLEPDVDAGINLYDKLLDNTLDMAIMPGTDWGRHFSSDFVGSVENAWMASPALGVKKGVLSPDDMADYPVLMQSARTGVSKIYDNWMRQNRIFLKKVFSTNSLSVLGELTLAGLGISQLPIDYYAGYVQAGMLEILQTDPPLPPIEYYAVHREDGFSPVVKVIIEEAKRHWSFARRDVVPRLAAGGMAA
jgi:DNA-binding transcriptional LysR family regulator